MLLSISGMARSITAARTSMSIESSGRATMGMPTPMMPFIMPANTSAHASTTRTCPEEESRMCQSI
jgi:hypothetical protein